MKKSTQYLIIFIIGIVLVFVGAVILAEAINGGNNSQIVMKSILLFVWILFTASNLFIYKKEKMKENMNE